jgi:hypothetical protein
MLKKAKVIPNEPGLLVFVEAVRIMRMVFGPQRGKEILIPRRFVGASAREVATDEVSDRSKPVVWRFLCGNVSGGDDLRSAPAWREERIEIPLDVADAREPLEQELLPGHRQITWYVQSPEERPKG